MRTTVVVERAQLVARTRADGRHVYREEGKAALVAACSAPGALVAAIAMAHGVNANLLRKCSRRLDFDEYAEKWLITLAGCRWPHFRAPRRFASGHWNLVSDQLTTPYLHGKN